MPVEDIVQILVTCIASMGFALFFNVYRSHILIASLGGVMTWVIYKLFAPIAQLDRAVDF